jgi:GDP-L-fucose synthase
MKIFVTGGSGFLGKHMVAKLISEGHKVIAPSSHECNLQEVGSLERFRDTYDQIYHLAAYTQAGDWCLNHSGEQWIVNQKMNTNVLSWWFENQRNSKLIAIGTSCSYAPSNNLIEEKYMDGEPIQSLYTYAMTKRMLLQGLRALNKQYGMNFLYVVPATLYGPGYHQDGRQMHFIFDLIRKILRGRDFDETVSLWGDGNQRREVVHVEDFLINLASLVTLGESDIYNLGSGVDYTIREFSERICKIVNYDFNKIEFDPSRYVGAKSKLLNVSKARSEVTNFASRSLESGLIDVIAWFEATKSHVL